MTRLEKDMDSDEVKTTIDENMKLADALGVSGTPTYVVGDEVVVGAVGLDELKAKDQGRRNKRPRRVPLLPAETSGIACGVRDRGRILADAPASPLRGPSL